MGGRGKALVFAAILSATAPFACQMNPRTFRSLWPRVEPIREAPCVRVRFTLPMDVAQLGFSAGQTRLAAAEVNLRSRGFCPIYRSTYGIESADGQISLISAITFRGQASAHIFFNSIYSESVQLSLPTDHLDQELHPNRFALRLGSYGSRSALVLLHWRVRGRGPAECGSVEHGSVERGTEDTSSYGPRMELYTTNRNGRFIHRQTLDISDIATSNWGIVRPYFSGNDFEMGSYLIARRRRRQRESRSCDGTRRLWEYAYRIRLSGNGRNTHFETPLPLLSRSVLESCSCVQDYYFECQNPQQPNERGI